MRLLEYEGKRLLKNHGIEVPQGHIATNAREAFIEAQQFLDGVVLKAQVPTRGRGRAGGIKIIDDRGEVKREAQHLLEQTISGYPVSTLLVEEKLLIEEELFLSILLDEDSGEIHLFFSRKGGVHIESVADESPEKIYRLPIRRSDPPPSYILRSFLRQGGFTGERLLKLTSFATLLLDLFITHDLLVAEINPLFILSDGRVLAGDAKIEVDDNALFRQDFKSMYREEKDVLEKKAKSLGLTYIKLEGSIGVIASGAGLGMATMDLLDEYGYPPANFLETGGGITEELMYEALKLVSQHEKVQGIIVNLYGGVNPIEKGAAGLVRAFKEIGPPLVMVVKALGNRQKECWEILERGGIEVISSVKTEDAVQRLIEQITLQEALR